MKIDPCIARWKLETRSIALLVVTGLVVSWVTHGVETGWKSFATWRQFFGSWVIHTAGVAFLTALVGGATVATHRLFLGMDHDGDHARLTFYVVMTVLVGAICVAIIAEGTFIWQLW